MKVLCAFFGIVGVLGAMIGAGVSLNPSELPRPYDPSVIDSLSLIALAVLLLELSDLKQLIRQRIDQDDTNGRYPVG